MADTDMRLRLVVRRDGFPEERLVWNISLENDPTISKLLEKVNEVLPLEVGQKGLENYVVELHDDDGMNFECLHFQPLRTVLKPDDRVFIRALEKDDNRRRRISGRDQISTDGRHLIDGLPFGRRLLRAPSDRPLANPHPRKRARLAYSQEDAEEDDDDDDDFVDGDNAPTHFLTNGDSPEGTSGRRRVRIDADFNDDDAEDDGDLDNDGELDETNMDDEPGPHSGDHNPPLSSNGSSDGSGDDLSDDLGDDLGDDEDLEDELRDLKEDNAAAQEEAAGPTQSLRAAFPSVPAGLRKQILTSCSGDLKVAYGRLAEGFEPALSESAMLSLFNIKEHASSKNSTLRGPHSKQMKRGGPAMMQGDEMEVDEDSSDDGDMEEVSDFVREYDHRGFPPGSINSGRGLAHMATISGSVSNKLNGESETTSTTLTGDKTSPDQVVDEEDTSSSDPLSSDSEDDSSEADSDSDSDSGSFLEDSNGSDDEDSDDDGEDDDAPRPRNETSFDTRSQSDTSSDGSDDSDDGPEESSTKPTASSNSRKVGQESRDPDSDVADTSSDSSMSSSEDSSDSENEDEETAPSSHTKIARSPVVQTAANDLEQTKLVPFGAGNERTKKRNARRRAAKKAKILAKGAQGADVSSTDEEARHSAPISDEKAIFEARRRELLEAIASGGVELGSFQSVDKAKNSSRTPTAVKRKHGRHGKLDQDHGESTPAETFAGDNASSSSSTQKKRRADDLEAWRDKITYRAVECCHEGVELSEPPFPFVQRWDPQQQGSWFQKKNKRGGQSKRAQRNEGHFYQDSRAGKKRSHEESSMWDEEGYDDTYNEVGYNTNDADIMLNYDEEVGQCRGENEASQFTDMDDLPSLPPDVSDLPDLRPGEVKVGMVITWQHWSCSSATNWQPQLSSVTGIVLRIDDDATGLEVCLAKRDRYLDRNKKQYDEDTGQRIYDRFEAPDLDDGEEEDEGFRTIGFADMQQPKILQEPLPMTLTEESNGNGDDPRETSPGLRTSQREMQGQDVHQPEPSSIISEGMEIDVDLAQSGQVRDVPSKAPSDVEDSVVHQPGHGQQITDTSMSNSESNSPSRQLHENTSQAISVTTREQSPQDISSREYYASDDTSEQPDNTGVTQSSSFRVHEDEVATGTPKVVKSKVVNPPSSVSSARSGRQPDYTLDIDNEAPDSFKMTDDGVDDVSAIVGAEDKPDAGSGQDASAPTPKRSKTAGLSVSCAGTPKPLSPANPSTPSSLASLNTVWHTAVTSCNTQS
ncbi:hypothetical protein GGR52DRAFT_304633 [Hypoxylon sp. FL1284]|nr:hypothetical protein GGR52DRAFT_304633 [Hypoxylon sp. FL1284]